MKNKVNYLAVLTFYVVAVALRYLTNKTDLLEHISSTFIKVLLQGVGLLSELWSYFTSLR
ncbi:Uncharacterised protein [Sphingobacterium spiritivorum]|uniref:Uncharacterized protein n=1 Tax=Sphingobacterium spiritivorum TaxID=258 RepID=A0A380CRM1_SPHSI|nr:hypothetical protein [Sphingobacterium spiritivorum]SUJ27288.1 Uncharacterised protein [Sphingobacterium spiritivorum]